MGYSFNFKGSSQPVLRRHLLMKTATLDFPSVAAASGQTLTVSVPGAKVGDHAAVSRADAGGPTAGIILQAWVSATDTVTVRATNITAAAVDPASGPYVVKVTKAG